MAFSYTQKTKLMVLYTTPEGVTLESAQVGDTMMVAYIGVSPYGRGSLLFNGKGVNQNLD